MVLVAVAHDEMPSACESARAPPAPVSLPPRFPRRSALVPKAVTPRFSYDDETAV